MNDTLKEIIVIDNDELDNWILEKLTKTLAPDVNVKCFTSAVPVLQHLQTNNVEQSIKSHIIFLGLYMPAMDGYGFLREIEKLGLADVLHIYILTATIIPNEEEKIEQFKSVKQIILKPITDNVLQRILK